MAKRGLAGAAQNIREKVAEMGGNSPHKSRGRKGGKQKRSR